MRRNWVEKGSQKELTAEGSINIEIANRVLYTSERDKSSEDGKLIMEKMKIFASIFEIPVWGGDLYRSARPFALGKSENLAFRLYFPMPDSLARRLEDKSGKGRQSRVDHMFHHSD